MKPFYSIDELASIFSDDCYQIADALLACNVPLIHDGGNANLSRWRRPVSTGSDGSIWVTTGVHPVPNPDQVVVSTDALPESWVLAIKDAEMRNKQLADQELERVSGVRNASDTNGKKPTNVNEIGLIAISGQIFGKLQCAIAAFPSKYPDYQTKRPKLNNDIRPWLRTLGTNDREAHVFGAIIVEHFKLSDGTLET